MARPNRTRLAVLGMLAIGERSGYDLKKEFERRMSHFWAESVGQIYPTLKSLEDEGLVRARRKAGTGRRPRRVYAITARGRRELRAWLQESPRAEQVRIEILLKLYFGPEMGTAVALEHLAQFEARQRALLARMKAFDREIAELAETDEQELFWQITLSSGLHVVRARIAWAEQARHKLKRWRPSRAKAREAS